MAIDEAVAERTAEDGVGTLRFYAWDQPTLSLGYFQALSAREVHTASRGCPVVRRASGGGAILHDQELTYSLALPMPVGAVGDAPHWYNLVHSALVESLLAWNIAASVRPCPKAECHVSQPAPSSEPFLCFQRQAVGDVLVNGTKICGSAQRRRRDVLSQHGSVLLESSPAAPELAGLRELTGARITAEDLLPKWLDRLTLSFALPCQPATLSAEELARAKTLVAEKYGVAGWTGRR